MNMPTGGGYKFVIAARDDLSLSAEGRALRSCNASSLASFFWEEIFCRYGAVKQVVTDNGPEIEGAFRELLERYRIPQTKISPYNKQANGVVERGHFTIRESLMKACGDKPESWYTQVPLAFFADRVTISRVTGFSPFYMLHGVHPVLPFDLTEATFMIQGYRKNISTSKLLALRIRQLQKRPEDLEQAAQSLIKN
jgi:transposase InsO family protein